MFTGIKLPHWAQLLIAFSLYSIAWVLGHSKTGDLSIPAWGIGLLTTLQGVLGLFSDSVQTTRRAAMAAKLAALKLTGLLGLALIMVTLAGCMPTAPIVPVTPQNQMQFDSCTSSSSWHNGAIIVGIGTGAVGTGAGSIAAADSDPNARAALAITAAAAAALAGGAATVAALAAQNYANGQCSSVLGNLPMKKTPQASAWPIDWPPPTYADEITSAESVMSAAGAR